MTRWRPKAAAVLASCALAGYLARGWSSPAQGPAPAAAPGRFEFLVVESFNAKYQGDTPGHPPTDRPTAPARITGNRPGPSPRARPGRILAVGPRGRARDHSRFLGGATNPSPQPSPARGEGARKRETEPNPTPSPLAGEGWGEGAIGVESTPE